MESILNTLHSTMFPINQPPEHSERDAVCALHSTMFPINQYRHAEACYRHVPLYSTMFPINLDSDDVEVLVLASLHSTMFPINLASQKRCLLTSRLYIPLCFLLIARMRVNGIREFPFTFHYVSY